MGLAHPDVSQVISACGLVLVRICLWRFPGAWRAQNLEGPVRCRFISKQSSPDEEQPGPGLSVAPPGDLVWTTQALGARSGVRVRR